MTLTASGNAGIESRLSRTILGAGSLLLDGKDNSFLALSNAVVFANGTPWSVAFWAQRGETSAGQGMVMGRRETNNDFIWLNDNFTGFRFRSSTGANVDFTTVRDLNVHHYALSASGSGALTLYVDGVLATNATGVNTAFYIDTIGLAYPTNNLHYAFKGLLDDVRVYDQTLDATSVSNLYQLRQPLTLQYAFEGNLNDSGSSGNTGTAGGNATLVTGRSRVIVGSGALMLDGADSSLVALAQTVTFSNTMPWSVAFWAQRSATGNDKGMIMGEIQTSDDFIWLNDSFLGLRFRSSNSTTLDLNAPKDCNRHHYALVATGEGRINYYVDGLLASNVAMANTSFTINTLGQGYVTNANHYGFAGVLDDVRMCGYTLDTNAVWSLFKMGQTTSLHYTFDGTVKDSSVSNNDGKLVGTAALTADAAQVAVGTGALVLDAAGNSYVALSNALAFSSSEPWSVAFWARRGELGSNKGMVVGSRTNNNDFIWLNDAYNGFRFRASDNTTIDFTTTKDLNLHHYALVAAGGGGLKFYCDGVAVSSATIANTSFVIDSVGRGYTGSNYDFKGVLDDVRVYAYSLDGISVSNLFTLGTNTTPVVTSTVTVERVRVYLVAGQSNADGRAVTTNLSAALQQPQTNIDFYYNGTLTTLRPLTSSGSQFGPEITFGQRLATLVNADATNRIALIKYAVGGTTLYSDWKANGTVTTNGEGARYISFQQTVTNGWKALLSAYPTATFSLEGMIWMQGESDVPSASAAYFSNLTNFIADVRLTYNSPRLPFIVGRLAAGQTGAGNATLLAVVRQAQTDVAAADPWTGLVDTDSFALKPDVLHFDDQGQQALGTAFAEQMLFLRDCDGRFTEQQLSAGAAEPDADPDADGVPNWNEWVAGTDPALKGSVFAMTNAPALNEYGRAVIHWPSVAGRVYAIERSTNLTSDAFAPIASGLPAVPPLNIYTDTIPQGPSAFYRIRVTRP